MVYPRIFNIVPCAILPEKAMAPHSSTLAWKMPWTEEPGRLQSMRLLRVRQDWETSLSLFIFMHWRRKWQPTPVSLPGESQGRGNVVSCRLWGHTESDTTEQLSVFYQDKYFCWVLKNWCFWTVVLDKTLESPLDSKEIKPVNPKGNQPWIFIGRTDTEVEAPILWPPDAKSQLCKRPWCWERLRAGGEGDDKGCDGLMVITDSMDMNLSKLLEIMKNRGAWPCWSPW